MCNSYLFVCWNKFDKFCVVVLLYGNEWFAQKETDVGELTIPHALLQERTFVLRPMLDILTVNYKHPSFVHTLEKTYNNLSSLNVFYRVTPFQQAQTSLQVYILPVVQFNVDSIGGPNVGLKGFVEPTSKIDTRDPTCSTKYSVNFGLQLTVGAQLN